MLNTPPTGHRGDESSTSATAGAVLSEPRPVAMAIDAMIAASEDAERARGTASKIFDLRIIIAGLFGFYGLFLTMLGFLNTTAEELEKSGGIRVNLTTGIGFLVFAALFAIWAVLRPLHMPSADDDTAEL
ncbi:hypothetical protein [Nocardia carnea]|uniref:hypothetical protein n=1 Tax=Nocardia carnea TaxID=37328 RepID=UPI0024585F2C|nr:hypothetical protein [Nocardia carnea]